MARILFLLISLTAAVLSSNSFAETCSTLYAGQDIDAGTVCMDNDDTYLYVTYQTTGEWSLGEVHLWVGTDLADMPQTKRGNPKIGLFPYQDTVNDTSYEFVLPLGDFGQCGDALALAAHAVVQKTEDDGTIVTETGWADGDRIVSKGSWATWTTYTIDCDDPNGGTGGECETAFAFGDTTLNDLGITRWGWQSTVNIGDVLEQDLWAGAGQNDTSKGTLTGDVQIINDGVNIYVTYITLPGFVLKQTHVYAGEVDTSTGAPGQFGNTHDPLADVTYDQFIIPLTADPAYVVAHAVVCEAQ